MKVFLSLLIMVSVLFAMNISESMEDLRKKNISELPEDNKDVKSYVEKLEKSGVNHPNEYVMLGITYEFGMPKAGINKNLKKALFYYNEASKEGIVYASIRKSIILLDEKEYLKSENILDKVYFEKKQTIEEDKIIIVLSLNLAEINKKSLKKYFFLKEYADKYNNAEAALEIFFMKYYGKSGVERDLKEAELYLNKACLSIEIKESTKSFCLNSNLIEKVNN